MGLEMSQGTLARAVSPMASAPMTHSEKGDYGVLDVFR